MGSDRLILLLKCRVTSAEPGVENSIDEESRISSFAPLPTDRDQKAFNLYARWLEDCLKNHDECRRTITGTTMDATPYLPSRVIDVGNEDDQTVKLVVSKMKRADYCALSHCWGPPHLQPLRTVKSNLASHLKEILLTKLPKTFQDAVEITRKLGIGYIWIDSLCIIQDDTDDWLRESEKMGALYEQAILTISAVAATNSTEGCFVYKRKRNQVIEIQLTSQNAIPSRLFCSLYEQESSLNSGPLRERAWTCQEYHLSRRMLLFHEEGPHWKCRRHGLDQRNRIRESDTVLDWSELLEQYSRCKITYETDRLIALQGMANELQKGRNDEYRLGVWTGDLIQQVLWMMEVFAQPNSGLTTAPSWSWASKSGSKHFSSIYPATGNNMAKKISIIDDSTLSVNGSLRKCSVSVEEVDFGCVRHYRWNTEHALNLEREAPIHHLMGYEELDNNVVGIAAMDLHETQNDDLYCLFLRSEERYKEDPLYFDATKPSSATVEIQNITHSSSAENRTERAIKTGQLQCEICQSRANEIGGDSMNLNTFSHIWGLARGKHYYRTLLLQKAPLHNDMYTRVGYALVFSAAWAENADVDQEVRII